MTSFRPPTLPPIVIQKRVLGEARQALKKYLKANFEDEPLNHPMGRSWSKDLLNA